MLEIQQNGNSEQTADVPRMRRGGLCMLVCGCCWLPACASDQIRTPICTVDRERSLQLPWFGLQHGNSAFSHFHIRAR